MSARFLVVSKFLNAQKDDSSNLFPIFSQAANLQGVKMLCTNAEGASLRGCNFEDPAGIKANLEGEEADLITLNQPLKVWQL